jgi:hypothetical protein
MGISNQIKVATVNRPSPMTSQLELVFVLTLAVIALVVVWECRVPILAQTTPPFNYLSQGLRTT